MPEKTDRPEKPSLRERLENGGVICAEGFFV